MDAVYRLRHHLGSDAIEGRSAWIRLNPGLVRCDVVAFEKALEAGDLAAAAGEYGGAFLDGVHLRDSTEFEHWREGEVRRLDREARTALEMLADQADLAGDPEGAADWLRRLLGIDPFNSR